MLMKLFALRFRDLIDDVRQPQLLPEGRNHRIARQEELAELGAVVQIPSGDVELEWRTTRQRLAPKELVIPPECWTVSVRISSGRRVGSEVERDVDRFAKTHLSTVHPSATAVGLAGRRRARVRRPEPERSCADLGRARVGRRCVGFTLDERLVRAGDVRRQRISESTHSQTRGYQPCFRTANPS